MSPAPNCTNVKCSYWPFHFGKDRTVDRYTPITSLTGVGVMIVHPRLAVDHVWAVFLEAYVVQVPRFDEVKKLLTEYILEYDVHGDLVFQYLGIKVAIPSELTEIVHPLS